MMTITHFSSGISKYPKWLQPLIKCDLRLIRLPKTPISYQRSLMVRGIDLFFALFNNLAIFIALVTVYRFLLIRFRQIDRYKRQLLLGLSFGAFAIGSMYAKIPVFEGVIVDQRNAIVALSGSFGGPLSAAASAVLTGAFRIYLGGEGVIGGFIGVDLAALAGIGLFRLQKHKDSIKETAVGALAAALFILPGFLFIGDLSIGWRLMKAMSLPYGSAIFLGIFLGSLLINREETRVRMEESFRESEKNTGSWWRGRRI